MAIVIATVFLIPQPANAATLQPEKPEVKTAINEFLKSIPGDYYVVGSVEKFKNFVATKTTLVVNVRDCQKMQKVKLPMQLCSIDDRYQKISTKSPRDKLASTTVPSYTQRTVDNAMTVLRVLGYDNIRSFPPSIKGWTAAGEPLEK